MNEPTGSLRVHFFTLTDTRASEHMYAGALRAALEDRNVTFVDDWRQSDVVHLFEVNFFTRDAIESFRFPELYRILRSEVPVVVSTDDLYFVDDPSLTARPRLYQVNARTQRWLFERCDAVIAISESVERNLSPALSSPEVHVVHHGVDDRYDDHPTDGEPYVLHVSLASDRKNPDAIVEVAERLDGRFVLAGGGWEDYVPEDLQEDDVELAGYVPEDELVDLYGDAGVFYFPTLHEGFGLPVLEAMAAGNAVVTSDVYSVPEVAGDAAVLHDPRDVDAHLESLEALLEDDDHRRSLGEAARERAREFTWADSARETEAVYRSVLDARTRSLADGA